MNRIKLGLSLKFENGRKFDVETRCKTLMSKKCTYTLTTDHTHSKSVEKCHVFISFQCCHDAVSIMCQLEFRFQNLLFSKFAGKNVPFSCEWEAYPSHLSLFTKCAGIVCAQSEGEGCRAAVKSLEQINRRNITKKNSR